MYRTPPKYCPNAFPPPFAPGPRPSVRPYVSCPVIPRPRYAARNISRIWLSRARASRIRAGDERNSEFRMCERLCDGRIVRAGRGDSRARPSKRGITMPKRAPIVVGPTDTADNSQCAKCIGIKSGRFIFAPTRPDPACGSLSHVDAVIFARDQKSAPGKIGRDRHETS